MWTNKRYGAGEVSQGIEKIVKRLTFTILAVGAFIMLAVLFLVGYGVHRINQAIPLQPDNDLQALEQLLRRKLIVLTKEQKDKLAPIVRELTQEKIVPEKVKPLKDKMWDILDSDQVKSLREWSGRASSQMEDRVQNSGSSLQETVKKYKQDIEMELTDQYEMIHEKWLEGHTKAGNNLLKMLE